MKQNIIGGVFALLALADVWIVCYVLYRLPEQAWYALPLGFTLALAGGFAFVAAILAFTSERK